MASDEHDEGPRAPAPKADAAPPAVPNAGAGPSAVRWPFLHDERPRSVRLPWSRSVLGACVGLLLPFVWVVEANECGSHLTTELTGSALLDALPTDDPDLWGIGAIVLFSLAAPWLAAAIVKEGPRLVMLVVLALSSLLTTLFGAGMALFTIFASRTLRPAGHAVIALLVLFSVDALVRLGFGIHEWLVARAARSARPASPTTREPED